MPIRREDLSPDGGCLALNERMVSIQCIGQASFGEHVSRA
jgi:hypothetical protein